MSEVLYATAALLAFEQSNFNISASFRLAGMVSVADPLLAVNIIACKYDLGDSLDALHHP